MQSESLCYTVKMASSGIYRPEFLVVPLFFHPDKDDLPMGKLLQPDSVLKYLMDSWKEEAILRQYEEIIAHLRLSHTRGQQIKKEHIDGLAVLIAAVGDKLTNVFQLRDVISEQWESAYQTSIAAVENDILISILKYYAVLEEHKRLSELQHSLVQRTISSTEEALRLFRRLNEYSACLEFETLSAVKLVKLTSDSTQFQRCRKAMLDNQKADMFAGKVWKGLKLMQAYKVENSLVLSKFERGLASSKAMLKGLFISVSKKQLPALILLGPQSSELIRTQGVNLYRQNFYRVPSTIGHKSKVEAFLAASDGFPKTITASMSCTLEKDRKKVENEENAVFYIVLCRVALSRKKSESEVNANNEYVFTDYSAIYPEYILICTKEPVLVLQQAYPIIPVSLAPEGRPESALLSKTEYFSRVIAESFENSNKQRVLLRDDIRKAFASVVVKSQAEYTSLLVDVNQHTHREVSNLLQAKVDLLRRKLLQAQRMNAALSSVLQSGAGLEASVNE